MECYAPTPAVAAVADAHGSLLGWPAVSAAAPITPETAISPGCAVVASPVLDTPEDSTETADRALALRFHYQVCVCAQHDRIQSKDDAVVAHSLDVTNSLAVGLASGVAEPMTKKEVQLCRPPNKTDSCAAAAPEVDAASRPLWAPDVCFQFWRSC